MQRPNTQAEENRLFVLFCFVLLCVPLCQNAAFFWVARTRFKSFAHMPVVTLKIMTIHTRQNWYSRHRIRRLCRCD